MIGILDYAAYVPIHRLSRAEIGRAWGRLVPPYAVGERAVANFDEDSVTMGTEAALRCLAQSEGQRPDGLYFASTTAPRYAGSFYLCRPFHSRHGVNGSITPCGHFSPVSPHRLCL